MARERVSYAWALKVSEEEGGSDEGLAFARFLARQALEWRREALRGNPRPYPLTVEELAEQLELDPTRLAEQIAEARDVHFGSLSESGIYAKLKREAARGEAAEAPMCMAPDCENRLPYRRSARREYCHSRCRRRYHYQRLHPGSQPAPHLRGERRSQAPPLEPPEQLERTVAFIFDHIDDPERAERRSREGYYRTPKSPTRDSA